MSDRAKVVAKTPELKKGNSVNKRKKTDLPQPTNSPVDHILYLQRIIGNQEVQRMMKSGALQAKLTIGQPNDKYEQEADRVADQVMRMPEPRVQRQLEEEEKEEIQPKSLADQITPLVQGQVEPEEEEKEEKELLRTKGTSGQSVKVTPDLESRIQSLKGGGQPLPKSVRTFFEPRFGVDFSQVRAHTGTQAAKTAMDLNSQAFTVGKDVVFGSGQYNTYTSEGQRLLAHELAHVVQQSRICFQSKSAIQRWGPGDHEKLTKEGVKKPLSGIKGFKMNEKALNKFAVYSNNMDFKIPELLFNWGAELATETYEAVPVGGGYPLSPEMKKRRRLKAHKKLIAHYTKNRDNALNHGEGGLYYYPKNYAAKWNKNRQKQYEIKAKEEFNKMPQEFKSLSECERIKREKGNAVLKILGDAMHVAQDRGAHGEGGRWQGHAREIWQAGFNPDDKGKNELGYKEAQDNTNLVVWNVLEILYELLNTRLTCKYHPEKAEVRTVT